MPVSVGLLSTLEGRLPEGVPDKNDDIARSHCGEMDCKHPPLVELLPVDHPGMFRVLYCAQHATQRIAQLLRERGVQ